MLLMIDWAAVTYSDRLKVVKMELILTQPSAVTGGRCTVLRLFLGEQKCRRRIGKQQFGQFPDTHLPAEG